MGARKKMGIDPINLNNEQKVSSARILRVFMQACESR